MYAVIIAGGAGERFWPRSRSGRPKQFLPIAGSRTMLEATVDRVKPVIPPERIFVCTGSRFSDLVRRIVPEIPAGNIIAEPCGRNTAAACGFSALKIGRRDSAAVMAVLPADHVIADAGRFREALCRAAEAASSLGSLVVFGIKPDRPATGYGYIRAGECLSGRHPGLEDVFSVECFLEKPDAERAGYFVRSGNYYWNSGMFVWSYDSIMAEIKAFLPELYAGLGAIGGDESRLEEVYPGLPEISVDYGIMEKTGNTVMVKGDFGWNDIGSWDALDRVCAGDKDGNIVQAENFEGIDSRNSVIASDGPLVAAAGVEDMVIVAEGGVVLVCRKDRAQDVKKIVERLKEDRELKKYVE